MCVYVCVSICVRGRERERESERERERERETEKERESVCVRKRDLQAEAHEHAGMRERGGLGLIVHDPRPRNRLVSKEAFVKRCLLSKTRPPKGVCFSPFMVHVREIAYFRERRQEKGCGFNRRVSVRHTTCVYKRSETPRTRVCKAIRDGTLSTSAKSPCIESGFRDTEPFNGDASTEGCV